MRRGTTSASPWWGLPDAAVREARDRVIAAVTSSGFYMPCSGYATFNLAPADLPSRARPLTCPSR